MRNIPHLALCLPLTLAACAQAPHSVAPAEVGETRYFGWTCRQLRMEQMRLNRSLATLYAEQSQSRTDDVIGYLTVLRPLASMSEGDLRHQIALAKGEQGAVERLHGRDCSSGRS